MACTTGAAPLEVEFQKGVGSTLVWANSTTLIGGSMENTCNPAQGEKRDWDLTMSRDSKPGQIR